jgi:hypothetical protein
MRHTQLAAIIALLSMGIAGAQQTPDKNVKTMALDPKTKRACLPAAEIDVIPAASATERRRRKIRAGSFAVLVLRPTQNPATKP